MFSHPPTEVFNGGNSTTASGGQDPSADPRRRQPAGQPRTDRADVEDDRAAARRGRTARPVHARRYAPLGRARACRRNSARGRRVVLHQLLHRRLLLTASSRSERDQAIRCACAGTVPATTLPQTPATPAAWPSRRARTCSPSLTTAATGPTATAPACASPTPNRPCDRKGLMPLIATRTLGTGDGWDITDSGIYVPDWADLNDVRPGSIIENPDRQPIRRRGLSSAASGSTWAASTACAASRTPPRSAATRSTAPNRVRYRDTYLLDGLNACAAGTQLRLEQPPTGAPRDPRARSDRLGQVIGGARPSRRGGGTVRTYVRNDVG